MYNSLCSLITAKSLFLKKLEGEKKWKEFIYQKSPKTFIQN
jgi:hypothetical protein